MKCNLPFILKFKAYCLSLAVLVVAAGCQAQSQQPDPNRAYFEIHPLYKTMIVPVTINDTLTARMGFDTGATLDCFDLDSAFCAAHPLNLWQQEPDTILMGKGGSAWTYEKMQGGISLYDKGVKVNLGQTETNYKWLRVWDQKGFYGDNGQDGFFNMPVDTAHVWELNFEHNYIELHPSDTFTMPESCLVVPIYIRKTDGKPYATIPMKITTSDGDTLTITRDFLVDMGMDWDVAVVAPAEELSFLKGKDALPFYFADNRYFYRHIVDAEIFDGFPVDSLRIYTLNDRGFLPANYLVGLNFLKRFNVFIDFRNMKMYLLPLKEFHREINLMSRRYSIGTSKTAKGSYIVTDVADYELNHYKKAGIRVGDEIVGFNGVALTPQTTPKEQAKLIHNYRVVIDVIRDGKPVQLVMERDPDEMQGD